MVSSLAFRVKIAVLLACLATTAKAKWHFPPIPIKRVVHSGPWIVGTPLWVAYETDDTNPKPFSGPAEVDRLFTAVGFDCQLKRGSEAIDRFTVPRPISQLDGLEGPLPIPRHRTAPWSSFRQFFVLPPLANIPPGDHTLDFEFTDPGNLSFEIEIAIATPTEEQAALIEKLSPFGPMEALPSRLSESELKLLEDMPACAFDVLLRKLFGQDMTLEEIAIASLPFMDSDLFGPQIRVLLADRLASKQRADLAEAMRDEAIEMAPGVAWQFKEIPALSGGKLHGKGGALIASERRRRQTYSARVRKLKTDQKKRFGYAWHSNAR